MDKRYIAGISILAVVFLLAALAACTVDSVFTIDDLSDILEAEEVTTVVYTYYSGSKMAYQIYADEIEVASDGTTSIGPIEDDLLYVTDLDTYYSVAVDETTLTITYSSYDPLIYVSE